MGLHGALAMQAGTGRGKRRGDRAAGQGARGRLPHAVGFHIELQGVQELQIQTWPSTFSWQTMYQSRRTRHISFKSLLVFGSVGFRHTQVGLHLCSRPRPCLPLWGGVAAWGGSPGFQSACPAPSCLVSSPSKPMSWVKSSSLPSED